MAYDLLEFCKDCRQAISIHEKDTALETIRERLEVLLRNQTFVSQYCSPTNKTGVHTLHHDKKFGFMVISHVPEHSRQSPPHDHGHSWAIYGQAVGYTDMSRFERIDDGSVPGNAHVKKINDFRLEPGFAGTFGPGEIHSIRFSEGARFIRVTGTDLSRITTRKFDRENGTVSE